jgi:hypothetical protein
MLITEDFEQARVLVALLVSIVYLSLHLAVKPHLRRVALCFDLSVAAPQHRTKPATAIELGSVVCLCACTQSR